METETSRPSRPTDLKKLREFNSSWAIWPDDIRDELLQHSRFIRDYLGPILATHPTLPGTELALLSSIITRVGAARMTMDLLRHSRIEKALMLVVYEAEECWPSDIVSELLCLFI